MLHVNNPDAVYKRALEAGANFVRTAHRPVLATVQRAWEAAGKSLDDNHRRLAA